MAAYHKPKEKDEVKGHNHPFNEKCGPHCPRNEHYKGPVRRFDFRNRKKSNRLFSAGPSGVPAKIGSRC